jgi:hypothetical protein
MSVSAPLRLGLLAAFLAAAGCSDAPAQNRTEEPALKAVLKKSMDIYKAKDVKKGHPMPRTR